MDGKAGKLMKILLKLKIHAFISILAVQLAGLDSLPAQFWPSEPHVWHPCSIGLRRLETQLHLKPSLNSIVCGGSVEGCIILLKDATAIREYKW